MRATAASDEPVSVPNSIVTALSLPPARMAGAGTDLALGRCMFVGCAAGCQKFFETEGAPKRCEVCDHHAGSHVQPKPAVVAKPSAVGPATGTRAPAPRGTKLSSLREAMKPPSFAAPAPTAASAGSLSMQSKPVYSWDADAAAAAAAERLGHIENRAFVDSVSAAATRLANGEVAKVRVDKRSKEFQTDKDRSEALAAEEALCSAMASSYWKAVAIIRSFKVKIISMNQLAGVSGIGSGPMLEKLRNALVSG